MRSSIIFIVATFFGALILLNYFIWKPQKEISLNSEPTATPIYNLDPKALVETPPALSQTGMITKLTGDVMFEPRGKIEYEPITEPRTVQQGEKLATGENSSVEISFGEDSTVSIAENAEVYIIQTLQNQFVLDHKKGVIMYTNISNAPFTVRSGAMIIELVSGEMKVNYDEEDATITVSVQKGTVEIAYNNADFVSQRVTLVQGDIFLFDIEDRDGEVL